MTPLGRNSANLVVLVRTVLALVAIGLLSGAATATRVAGFVALALAAALDGVDGYVARRLAIASRLGSTLDTLGDRITENVLFVYLAHRGLVPIAVPLLFVTRSFLADFVRALHAEHGTRGTFAMSTSRLGVTLVASPTSRASYLLLKFGVFLGGGWCLAAGVTPAPGALLPAAVFWASITAAAFNVARFVALVYDSRSVLRREFLR